MDNKPTLRKYLTLVTGGVRWRHFRQTGWSPVMLVLGLFSAALISCNPREEGCLDIDAENFDFEAESHLQSACRYPDLILSVLYTWNDTAFTPGQFYTNSLGQQLSLHQGQVLLSQFSLQTQGAGSFSVENTVDWPHQTGGSTEILAVPDDFTFVDRSSFWFQLGELRRSDMLTGYSFYIGIPDTLTPVLRDSLPNGHVLRSPKANFDGMTGAFATARFVIGRDTIVENRDTFLVYTPPILCQFDLSKSLVQGRNDSLYIEMNFGALFETLDLDQDSAAIVAELAAALKSGILDRN